MRDKLSKDLWLLGQRQENPLWSLIFIKSLSADGPGLARAVKKTKNKKKLILLFNADLRTGKPDKGTLKHGRIH